MQIQEHEFERFIKLLFVNGCLEHVVLVGSWAEYLYQELDLLHGFKANIKTMDIDFLIKNMRRPSEPISLANLARDAGYLVTSDRLTNVTKIYDKAGLEIEFLIGKAGAGAEAALKTNIGVTAQSLWHMDILSRNTQTVSYKGMPLCVPQPEAYAIHKMVINNERKSKQEKDRQAIRKIWPFLNPMEVSRIKERLTKKELASVVRFENENLA